MQFEKNIAEWLLQDDTDMEQDQQDFINLMSQEDEDKLNEEEDPEALPILALRNTVLFPGVVIPITVGRDKSIKIIREAYKKKQSLGVTAQIDPDIEDPGFTQLYKKGTIARIVKMLRMPDGNTTAIIQGQRKYEATEEISAEPYIIAKVNVLKEKKPRATKQFKGLIESIKEMALNIVEMSPNLPSEAALAIKNIDSPNFLVNFISSNLNIDVKDKQDILATTNLNDRANLVLKHLNKELQMLEIKNQIQSKVKGDIDKQQREYFLQQQIRAIQEELGQDSPDQEIETLRVRGENKKWSKEIHKAFNKELDRLMRMNPAAPDYSVGLNYAELLLDLPWEKYSKDNFDLQRAKKVLDSDHYGLEKVKDRILEYLAVLKLKGDMKSPILCLYGPPGVGKTSLGKSIAKAISRKYVRMSLGGLHDESELRGHRKTYIGAMPGRIIQSIKKVETSNPVFVLDEIDKIGNDFRGDPSSALLEILDPEQNNTFHDNYLELEYDLSKIMFVATANRLDTIQPALRDRMEIIEITGYTQEEKREIAKKHLIPKQRKEHGLKSSDFKLSDKVLDAAIDQYTRESGVRSLEKKIAHLARRQARDLVFGEKIIPNISLANMQEILGNQRIVKDEYQNNEVAGVVTGLAWTAVGGEILFVESTLTRGRGKITMTGQLGDIMKESAITALTYLKAHHAKFKIDYKIFDQYDVHIHFPAGAVPKDGPSAGITILTALASLITQRKVKSHLAMTGEVTLRGKVLPVGGIKEKVLAARRAGIKEIILCKENEKDLKDIDDQYLKGLTIHFVEEMAEVLDLALLKTKVANPIKWELSNSKKTGTGK